MKCEKPVRIGGDFFPCGKCYECLRRRQFYFVSRVLYECTQHSQLCFLTLTYNDDFLPSSRSDELRNVQLFIKRLRKSLLKFGKKIRYICSLEYGTKFGRPHAHLIIFGFVPSDLVYFFTTKKGEPVYKSEYFLKLWGKGYISVGVDVNEKSISYLFNYMKKKSDNKILASNRPGIGYMVPSVQSFLNGYYYVNGRKYPYTRIHRTWIERAFPDILPILRQNKRSASDLKLIKKST